MSDDLAVRIARLEAESDIRRLKARYLNACDRKDMASLRACFTSDAKIEYPPLGNFDLDGLVAIFEQLAATTPIVDAHQGHNANIVVQDADTAKGCWHLSFTTYDPRNGAFRLMSAFYEDRYVRTPDGWRIAFTRSEPRMIVDGVLAAGAVSAHWTAA
jgi:hypothetical protein